MASQQFSLKWHSHCQHLANSFNSLRGEEEFLTDVTLCCEGRRLRAHKIILTVCSTYFRETFMENPCKHPVVIFKNVKFDDLSNIVEFMYKGEVSISQDSLSSFLHVAEMLQVRGLSENQEIVPEKSLQSVTQPESLFISVPEGNKILLATPQNISSQQQTGNLIKSPMKLEQAGVQHIKTTFIDQSGLGAKRKRFTIKETRPAKIPANNANTNATSTQQFITEAVDNSFGKQETVIVDENGKESVFEEVEYLTMKSGMPECNYVVSAIENAGEQSQDNMEEMTLMQETFEIIEEGKQQLADDVNSGNVEEGGDPMNPTEETYFVDGEEKPGDDANNKWTQCSYCKLVITSVNLWRHVRTQHTSQPPRKCDFCKKTFKNKYSLREHVRISHENKQAPSKNEGEGDSDQPSQAQAESPNATAAAATAQSDQKVIYLEKL